MWVWVCVEREEVDEDDGGSWGGGISAREREDSSGDAPARPAAEVEKEKGDKGGS